MNIDVTADPTPSSKTLASINRKRVLNLLYHEKGLTRREIADSLNLSMPTVYKIIDGMMEDGLISEGGSQVSSGGRKPRIILFEPSSRYVIGVDIQSDGYRLIACDMWGFISGKHFYPIPFENTHSFWSDLLRQIRQFQENHSIPDDLLLGVGFAIHGIISKQDFGVQYSRDLHLGQTDLSFLRDELKVPTTLINDVHAAGYAEAWNNSRLNMMCYLGISSSVSGAILIRSELFAGFNNRAGSIGQMIVQSNESEPFDRRYMTSIEKNCSILRLTEPFGESLSSFFSHLEQGDSQHVEIWNQYLNHLAIALSNIRSCLDVAIIIGGPLGKYLDDYLDDLFGRLMKISAFPEKTRLFLNTSRYGIDASALGAAFLLIDRYLNL